MKTKLNGWGTRVLCPKCNKNSVIYGNTFDDDCDIELCFINARCSLCKANLLISCRTVPYEIKECDGT